MAKASNESKVNLQIDLDRLDDEWAEQPNNRYDAGCRLAEARREWSEAVAALGEVEAATAQTIRRNPEQFGLTKVTEAAIKELIPIQDAVRDANEDVINARHAMDVLDSEVQGWDHRKTALGKEVDLFLANYFSKPRAATTNRDDVTDMEMKRQAAKRNRISKKNQ